MDDDARRVNILFKEGCGCLKRCHEGLTKDRVLNNILLTHELNKDEKDVIVMTALSSSVGDITTKGTKRKRTNYTFTVEGKSVCRNTFMLFYNIGKHTLRSLMDHVNKYGVSSRKHGNAGRSPKHAIKYEDVLRIVTYIKNYADEHGLPQPAAPRGIDNIPCVYLPSNTTKVDMHKTYMASMAQERALKITSFKDIWRMCLPHIRISKPREDVCATCEKHRRAVMDAVTEAEKLGALAAMETHVHLAQKVGIIN